MTSAYTARKVAEVRPHAHRSGRPRRELLKTSLGAWPKKKAAAFRQRLLSNQRGTASLRSGFRQEPLAVGSALRARTRLRCRGLWTRRLRPGSRPRLRLFDLFFDFDSARGGRGWLRDT